MKNSTTTNSSKVLIPLASLVAAAAVAIGSGATWTSSTDASVSVTSGTLLHSNDHDGATLTLDDLRPGDTVSGTVEVVNTGTDDSTMSLEVTSMTNTFSDLLEITIANEATELYSGPVAGLRNASDELFFETAYDFNAADGETPADSATYTFTVELVNDTTGDVATQNVDQDQSADITFTFNQTQIDGAARTGTWVEPTP